MADLTRLTVNLTPRASAALDQAAEQSGDSKTDTVNRALVLYGALIELIEEGGGRLQFQAKDGGEESVVVL